MSRLPATGARGVFLLFSALVPLMVTGCGAALQQLPRGPGAPAADAAPAFADAVAACRRVRTMSAEMSVGGSAGGQRLRGRVLVGVAAPASALLDAAAPFGASLFIYAAHDAQATLLLPRDKRFLRHDDPAAVLEAVTGVPLGAADLRYALTGCAPEGEATAGRELRSDWRTVTVEGSEIYLQRIAGRWRIVAVVRRDDQAGAWRADYAEFAGDLPRLVRLVSAEDGHHFDVRLTLSQVEINPELSPALFDVAVPPALLPITLDELRRNGPMADAK
jgi:hypothetical protein